MLPGEAIVFREALRDTVSANFGKRPGQVGFSDFQIIRADGSDVREIVSQGASHPAVKRTL